MENKEIAEYIEALEVELLNRKNNENALKQKAYMRGQFEYYGLTTSERREVQKPFLVKDHLPSLEHRDIIIKKLWLKDQREYQLFSQELMHKYIKQLREEDIELLEFMVTHKSWWDTVDFIAYKLMGAYFMLFPEKREVYTTQWLNSGNIWLQRSALLFQLKYKKEMDTALLSHIIKALLGSKEFFVNKAIGWVLRDYSRVNPEWVKDFVEQTELSALSRKEALRLMK